MTRLEVLQRIIDVKDYKKYIEIGTFTGWTLDNLNVTERMGVDISPDYYPGSYPLVGKASNDFFKDLDPAIKFDLVFLDGDHTAIQLKQDIDNSLKHLTEGGTIVCHDMLPPTEKHTKEGVDGAWNGTSYQAILLYEGAFPFNFKTVDTDWGMTVITPDGLNYNTVLDYKKAQDDWEYFDKNRKRLLNVITVDEFKELYK